MWPHSGGRQAGTAGPVSPLLSLILKEMDQLPPVMAAGSQRGNPLWAHTYLAMAWVKFMDFPLAKQVTPSKSKVSVAGN